jgi:DNA (cytosine-5)-methyltransferase 1
MRGFTFGSVCSGIEAASVAFGPLGMHASWLSEIEPFPSAVLAHHYPGVPNLGDMTTLPERILLGEVSAPDLFCGGTPCQAFSVAGLRKSLDDARGNLSLVFCEIANAIDIVRTSRNLDPAIVFWENVPGVLNTKDNAFGCFLAGLAGEDLPIEPTGGKWTNAGAVFGPSRAVAWRVLDAQYFGVAQRRRRVFVVASAREDFDPAAVLFEFQGLRRDTAPSREAGKVAPTIPSRSTAGGGLGTDFDLDGGVITMAHGQANAEIKPDGSAPTLTCVHEAPIAAYVSHTLRGEGFDASEDGTGRGTPLVPVAQPIALAENTIGRQPENGGNGGGYTVGGPMYTLNATGVHGVAQPVAFVQNSRDEVRLMGGDGSLVGALAAETGAKQQCYVAQPVTYDLFNVTAPVNRQNRTPGDPCHTLARSNAEHAAVVQPIAFQSVDFGADATVDLSPTMRSHDPMAVAIGTDCFNGGITGDVAATMGARGSSQNLSGPTVMQPIGLDEEQNAMLDGFGTLKARTAGGGFEGSVMTPAMQVRRLTPVECERLQGFPDGYTAIPWRNKPVDECPDGPRYKALGNSWAVPCVQWIGSRIRMEVLRGLA